MIEIICSRAYRKTPLGELGTFAARQIAGIFGNATVFVAPPITQPAFQTLIDNYTTDWGLFNAGTLARASFNISETALMVALDDLADYVDGIAAGNSEIVALSGFYPISDTKNKRPEPEAAVVELSQGTVGVIESKCKKVENADYYIAIITSRPFSSITINGDGMVLFGPDPEGSPDRFASVCVNKSRNKRFSGLVSDRRYYVYYIVGNSSGLSEISEVKSVLCN